MSRPTTTNLIFLSLSLLLVPPFPCSLASLLLCSFPPFLLSSLASFLLLSSFPPFLLPPFLPRSLICSFALLSSLAACSLAAPLLSCPLARCGRAQTSIHFHQERVGRSSSVGRSDIPPEKDTSRYQVPDTTGMILVFPWSPDRMNGDPNRQINQFPSRCSLDRWSQLNPHLSIISLM